jgi:hypothetical protein
MARQFMIWEDITVSLRTNINTTEREAIVVIPKPETQINIEYFDGITIDEKFTFIPLYLIE